MAILQGTAHAQAADENANDASREIIVTAQGREQRLKDVPVSVSVTAGVALERGVIRNLEDLSARVPNFRIGQSPTSDNIAIRGVGSSNNQGFEQSVGIFVDGIYRAKSKSSRSLLFDVDRVEVLRGPQTTFFGNNTIAGALNITTRRPTQELEGSFTGFYSPGAGEYTVDATANLPVSDNAAIRFAGRLTGMDGFVKNLYTGRKGPHNRDAFGRASIRWEPTSAISWNARVEMGHMRDRDAWNLELQHCPPNLSPGVAGPAGVCAKFLARYGAAAEDDLNGVSYAPSTFFDLDYVEAASKLEVDLGGPKLILQTGYHHYKNDMISDAMAVGAAGPVTSPLHPFPVIFHEKYEQFSQEIRLQSPTGGTIEYMVGAYYHSGRANNQNYVGQYFSNFAPLSGGAIPSGAPVAVHVFNGEKTDTVSGFGALTIRPVQSLRLNLGLRYTSTLKRATRLLEVGTGGDLPGPENFVPTTAAGQKAVANAIGYDLGEYDRPRRRDSRFLPAASLQYDLTDDAMVYFSYAKGFKAGGYAALTSKADFRPETVNSYEIGIKTTWLDKRLSLDLTVFNTDYKDLQETLSLQTTTGSTQFVTNVGGARTRGIEFSSSFRVSDALTVRGDFAYLDAKYTSYPNAPCSQVMQAAVNAATPVGQVARCVRDLSGSIRAFAPKFTASGGFTFTQPVSDSLQVRLDSSIYYTSHFYQNAIIDPYIAQDAYAKVDARLALGAQDGRWEVAVVGKNLTNHRTATYRLAVPTAPGTYVAMPEMVRSIGLQGSIKF